MSIRVSHGAGTPAPQYNSPTTAALVKIAGNPAGIKIAVGGGVYLHRQVGKVGQAEGHLGGEWQGVGSPFRARSPPLPNEEPAPLSSSEQDSIMEGILESAFPDL